jgi:hypothetical protein
VISKGVALLRPLGAYGNALLRDGDLRVCTQTSEVSKTSEVLLIGLLITDN